MDYIGDFIHLSPGVQIQLPEGRVLLSGSNAPEYQYYLKDHLGNTRITFTTIPTTDAVKATLEDENWSPEHGRFLNYDEAILVNQRMFDHTHRQNPSAVTYKSTRLTGGNTNAIYGLAKSLSVMPGDRIKIRVHAKYVDANDNITTGLRNFIQSISQISTAPPGTIIDGGVSGSLGAGSLPPLLFNGESNGEGVPNAGISFITFDKSFRPIMDAGNPAIFDLTQSNFVPVTIDARETGSQIDATFNTQDLNEHELLEREVFIKQPGYIYIYLSNENETPVDVFFDDFEVEHIHSPVIQMNDYYPFGLTYNSVELEYMTPQRYKFQGQEHIDQLGLNWDSFKWRNHMPEIGRFFNVDPIAEKYFYNSPYAFSENRVALHIELEGLESFSIKKLWGGVSGLGSKFADPKTYKEIGQGMKEYAVKGGNMIAGGANLMKAGFNKIGSAVQGKFGNLSAPKVGITVTITNDGPAGPNGSHLQDAKNRSENYHVDQSVVDALGSIAKGGPPGARASNSPPQNPGEAAPSTLPVGEAINGTVSAAVPAGQAAQEVFKPTSQNSNTTQPWTTDSIKVEFGSDSSYYINTHHDD
jgi:RHS repeat-associated protein